MRRRILSLVFLFSFLVSSGQETFRSMFYNLLEFPEAFPSSRKYILRDILEVTQPDIFMVCELQSEEGADMILETSLNHNRDDYTRAPFIPSESGALEHQQLLFYKRKMFTLEATEAIGTEVRDINYYLLKLNTADHLQDPVHIHIYVTHLKSSPGRANEQLRLEMVEKFVNHTGNIDPESFVIFAGDLNFYSSLEPAYLKLTDPQNRIIMADPLDRPGLWHENMNFMDIHTQSTRINPVFGAGAGGGMDDRFDFILLSENMMENPKLRYVSNSYKTIGNNGNCYKNDINSEDCSGFYDLWLRNKLYNMSDHLPVVLDLETNKEIVLQTPSYVFKNPIFIRESVIKNHLNLEIESLENHFSLEIFNVLGQKMFASHFRNRTSLSIDISHFAPGIYYLKTDLSGAPTLKFLKSS